MASRRHLILARHSLPEIVPGTEARTWRLGGEGRRRAALLADELNAYAPALIATSPEPKAGETAEIVAHAAGAPLREVAGLAEHDRGEAEFRQTRAEFRRDVEAFFIERDRTVFGRETAMHAYARFSRAIDQMLADSPQGNIVAVTHGRVMALFVSIRSGVDAFAFWQRLGHPCFVVLLAPDFEIVRTVDEIG
jgi:broad specificity phosphatase PhoE